MESKKPTPKQSVRESILLAEQVVKVAFEDDDFKRKVITNLDSALTFLSCCAEIEIKEVPFQ